jgi:hypothetical protein
MATSRRWGPRGV